MRSWAEVRISARSPMGSWPGPAGARPPQRGSRRSMLSRGADRQFVRRTHPSGRRPNECRVRVPERGPAHEVGGQVRACLTVASAPPVALASGLGIRRDRQPNLGNPRSARSHEVLDAPPAHGRRRWRGAARQCATHGARPRQPAALPDGGPDRADSPATSWRNRRASGPRHSSGGSAMRWTASRMQDAEDRDRDAARSAARNAVRNARHAGRVTMSATGNRAAGGRAAKPYTLRSLRADAIRTALPASTALTPTTDGRRLWRSGRHLAPVTCRTQHDAASEGSLRRPPAVHAHVRSWR